MCFRGLDDVIGRVRGRKGKRGKGEREDKGKLGRSQDGEEEVRGKEGDL